MKRLVAAGMVLAGFGVAFGQDAGRSGAAGSGAAKRPMTFQDLMAMKRVSDPQISPSGKWVLFSVTEVSLEKNSKVNHLWVVPVAGGEPTSQGRDAGHPERQVTSNSGESFGRFAPNGKFVSYTGAPTKDDPLSRITVAVWDEATGTIGAGRTMEAVSGDADGAIWSPDSKHFLFTTTVYPECSDKATWAEEDACDQAKDEAAAASPVKAQVFTHLLYRHWNAFTGEKRSHVIEADFSMDGPNPRDLTPRSVVGDAEVPTFSLGGPLGYAWAPDSKEMAYVANLDKVPAASTNNDVFTLRLDESGAKAVKVSTSLGSDDGPQYSPDGKWLAFRSQLRAAYESDRFRLMLFDRQAKAAKELMPNFDRWVDELAWAPDSNAIYFSTGDRGQEPVYEFDIGKNSLARLAIEPISVHGEFSELNLSRSGKQLVATRMTLNDPARIVVFHLDQTSPIIIDVFSPKHAPKPPDRSLPNIYPIPAVFYGSELTHLNDSLLAPLDLTALEGFDFKGAEGTKVQGFIVKPPNFDPKEKYPVKFLIHGGPQGAWGDAWSYRWNPELMAASGYVVVMVNPRGSTGYGQAFIDGVNGDWGGKPYIDLMKGLHAAEAQFPFIDKDRECALGASYGGFMANWVLTHTNRFKCIVTHDGMYNPAAAYGDTDELWFNEWEFRRPGDSLPGQPWRYASLPADQDPFRKWSPMLHIQDAKTPTLVIHSQKDYRLDVSEGFQLFTALQRLGVPSEMLYFPDEGHWVTKPQNAELWNKTVSDWCDQWIGQR